MTQTPSTPEELELDWSAPITKKELLQNQQYMLKELQNNELTIVELAGQVFDLTELISRLARKIEEWVGVAEE